MLTPAELRSFDWLDPRNCLGVVPTTPFIERAEFVEQYMVPRRPIVIRGFTAGLPSSGWSVDHVRRELGGDKRVELSRRDPRDFSVTNLSTTLDEFLSEISATPPAPLYLFGSVRRGPRSSSATRNARVDFPELAGAFPTPALVDESWLEEVNLWVAFEGAFTPLHFDPADNLLAVFEGTKHLALFAPTESAKLEPASVLVRKASRLIYSRVDPNDVHRSPAFGSARYTVATLNEGDALFIPTGYWHSVRSFGVNLAVNYWWDPPHWIRNWATPPVRRYALRNALVRWPLGKVREVARAVKRVGRS